MHLAHEPQMKSHHRTFVRVAHGVVPRLDLHQGPDVVDDNLDILLEHLVPQLVSNCQQCVVVPPGSALTQLGQAGFKRSVLVELVLLISMSSPRNVSCCSFVIFSTPVHGKRSYELVREHVTGARVRKARRELMTHGMELAVPVARDLDELQIVPANDVL
jgi:hypothetical protein